MATLGRLQEALTLYLAQHPTHHGLEVKIWLPGSTISIEPRPFTAASHPGRLLIEGNVDRGPALETIK